MKMKFGVKTLILLSCTGLCFSGQKPGGTIDLSDEITANIFTPSASGSSDPAYQSYREVVLDFFTAFKRNDTQMIGELLSPNYRVTNFGEIKETTYSKFTEMSKNLKVRISALHKALPDFDLKIEEMITERNKVMVQVSISGVQKGDFMGIAPTNKPIHLKFFATFTIRDDKIISISEMWNELNVMKQLGFIVL